MLREKHSTENIFSGCDPAVARAIASFRLACTPSYTTRSKKFSVWSLVTLHIEPALSAYLQDHRFLSYPECFDGNGFAESMRRDTCKLEDLLRFYIRLGRQRHNAETFTATLDSLISLCGFCKSRVPNRIVGDYPKGQKHPTAKRLLLSPSVSLVTDFPYCELCWQLCQHEDRNGGKNDLLRSARFCNEHDPRNSSSRYRTDHYYRKKFQQKLIEIYKDLPDHREKWRNLVGDIDEVSIRRYAYEFLHAHPIDDRLKVLQLAAAGHTNADIAKALGKSRQMVHKFLNTPLKCAFGLTTDGTIVRFSV